MSTLPLDSIARTSPLEMLAPAPRDSKGSDSFAQHLQAAPTSRSNEEETQSPRTADDARYKTAVTPAATAAPVSAKSDSHASDEEDAPSADAGSDDESTFAQQAPVAENPADVVATGEEEKDETLEEEDVAQDEVLISCTPCLEAQPVVNVVQPSEESTSESAETAEVAIAADIEKNAKPASTSKSPAPTVVVQQPLATDTAAVNEVAEAPSAATGEAPTAAPEMSVDAGLSPQAIPQIVDVSEETPGTENEQKPSGAKKKGVAKAEVKAKQQAEAGDNEPAIDEVPADQAVDNAEAAARPRETKRTRQRAEANAESPAAIAAGAAKYEERAASTANAVAAAAPTTTQATDSSVRSTDLTIPPPVAATSATTAPDAAAPQALQRLPQQLLAKSAAAGNRGAPVNPAEQTRFVARVAKAFQTAQARGGELQLRLSPAELGSLKLEIKIKDGVLSARVEAENANARSMLIDNLPVLKERLAEQGIVVEKFDVELMDRQPQGQPDTAQERERRQAPRAAYAPKTEDKTSVTTAGEPRTLRGDGRLNVTA